MARAAMFWVLAGLLAGLGPGLRAQVSAGWEVAPGGRAYAFAGDRAWALGPDGRTSEGGRFGWLGELSCLDASDPFRLALFFGQSGALLLLDPRWRELGPALRLEGLYRSPQALACLSARGGFWLFDPFDGSLSRYDERGRVATRLQPQLPPGAAIGRMGEQRGQVVLHGQGAIWAVRPDGTLALLASLPDATRSADWQQGRLALLVGDTLRLDGRDSLLAGRPPLALRLRDDSLYLFWADSLLAMPLPPP